MLFKRLASPAIACEYKRVASSARRKESGRGSDELAEIRVKSDRLSFDSPRTRRARSER